MLLLSWFLLHYHHHCSTAVETMDSTRWRQESRSRIAVSRSLNLSLVSMHIVSGKVSFLDLWGTNFSFHNRRDEITSEEAWRQCPANWVRLAFKSIETGFKEPYIVFLVGWSLQERCLTFLRSMMYVPSNCLSNCFVKDQVSEP